MKYKTTAKAIRECYPVNMRLSIGYCDAQYLLKCEDASAYTCGVYGWNFDVYEVDGVAICTGYRGMPKGVDYDYKVLDEYEKKAREIYSDYHTPYEEREKAVKALLREFVNKVTYDK